MVIDGRNPNFYISEDLKQYAKELGKPMLLIVNKVGSLKLSRQHNCQILIYLLLRFLDQGDYLSTEQRRLWSEYFNTRNWEHVFFSAHIEQAKLDKAARQNHRDEEDDSDGSDKEVDVASEPINDDPARLLTRQELTEAMIAFAKKHGCEPDPRYDNRYQFGTVGFPNVG